MYKHIHVEIQKTFKTMFYDYRKEIKAYVLKREG